MSLGRLFKDIAERQAGLISKFRTNYRFVFTPDDKAIDKQHKKIFKKLKHWTMDNVRSRFKVREDEFGRKCMIDFTRSVICLDPQKIDKYPYVKLNEKSAPAFRVSGSECKTCPHYKRYSRRKYYCELHRERNKDLLENMWENARSKCKEVFGVDF